MFIAIASLSSPLSQCPVRVGAFCFPSIPLQVTSKFPCDFSSDPLALQSSAFPSVIESQHHPAVVREYNFYGIELLKSIDGKSLVIQRLGFCALAAEDLGSIPGWGTKDPVKCVVGHK